jgi:hypothetical protein
MSRATSTASRASRSSGTTVPAVAGVQSVIEGLAHDAELARSEALEASDLGKLGSLQSEWATQQWLRAMQAWSGLWSGWFEAQSALWRDAERGLRASLQPWLSDVRPALALEPLLEPPDSLAPPVLMQRAIATWLALGQACLNTLDHDLDQGHVEPGAGTPRASAAVHRARPRKAVRH